jgi:hypothetical protein
LEAHKVDKIRAGMKVTTWNGWSGRITRMEKGFVMAQGPMTDDPSKGGRAFSPHRVTVIGDQAFVSKAIPQLRKPGAATPRKAAAAALEREDATRDTWRRYAPAY